MEVHHRRGSWEAKCVLYFSVAVIKHLTKATEGRWSVFWVNEDSQPWRASWNAESDWLQVCLPAGSKSSHIENIVLGHVDSFKNMLMICSLSYENKKLSKGLKMGSFSKLCVYTYVSKITQGSQKMVSDPLEL